MPTYSYRDLRVWHRAADLVVASHAVAHRLPASERFELGSQIRRAATSVTANIAEGNGRAYRRAYLHHLSIAMGSLKELESHLLIAARLGYVSAEPLAEALGLCDQVGRMLTGLTRKLSEPPSRG